ncbi:hypothetical protein EDB86DRAFT_2833429 [Lactarius hatsudake]|nr:hypothetical protein EDB86DRAFT_2833429 [Lactarius hatsudake]
MPVQVSNVQQGLGTMRHHLVSCRPLWSMSCRIYIHRDCGHIGVEGLGLHMSAARSGGLGTGMYCKCVRLKLLGPQMNVACWGTQSMDNPHGSWCYVLAWKWTLTLGDDTTSAVYCHGLVGSVSQYSLEQHLKAREYLYKALPLETRDPHELIPSSPSWAVDTYPSGSVYHHVFLYLNEHVGRPYGYIYIVDHPTWTTIVALNKPPADIPQEEDLHTFIALNEDLAPHPAEYTNAITNRLFYRPFRITALNKA